jgi:hypothetical protein
MKGRHHMGYPNRDKMIIANIYWLSTTRGRIMATADRYRGRFLSTLAIDFWVL